MIQKRLFTLEDDWRLNELRAYFAEEKSKVDALADLENRYQIALTEDMLEKKPVEIVLKDKPLTKEDKPLTKAEQKALDKKEKQKRVK